MRWLPLLAWAFLAPSLFAQSGDEKIASRFGIDADIAKYPQGTPKDALRSVLKAIEAKRLDYLLAHLAEPEFVDKLVKKENGKFEDIVKQITAKFDGDPEAIRDLRRFLSDGTWPEMPGDTVEVKCKEVEGKNLYLKKIGKRWFLENRSRPDADK